MFTLNIYFLLISKSLSIFMLDPYLTFLLTKWSTTSFETPHIPSHSCRGLLRRPLVPLPLLLIDSFVSNHSNAWPVRRHSLWLIRTNEKSHKAVKDYECITYQKNNLLGFLSENSLTKPYGVKDYKYIRIHSL